MQSKHLSHGILVLDIMVRMGSRYWPNIYVHIHEVMSVGHWFLAACMDARQLTP